MTLPRERATHEADLPHAFRGFVHGACSVCRGELVAPLHAAWEQAAAAHLPAPPTMPREKGV